MEIDMFEIVLSMGKSDDWQKLGELNKENVEKLNEIGYCGKKQSGMTQEEYLNSINSEKYMYKIKLISANNSEYTETYIVTRVTI